VGDRIRLVQSQLYDDLAIRYDFWDKYCFSKELYLTFINFLEDARFSPEQVAAMRAAYQEILLSLSRPVNRKIPPELSEAVARKVVNVAGAADYAKAAIVQMVLDEIGILRSDKAKR
jgi:hypothetical protein